MINFWTNKRGSAELKAVSLMKKGWLDAFLLVQDDIHILYVGLSRMVRFDEKSSSNSSGMFWH